MNGSQATLPTQSDIPDVSLRRRAQIARQLRLLARELEPETAVPSATPSVREYSCEAERRFYEEAHWGG